MEHRLPGLSLDREDDSSSLLVFLARSRVIEVNLHFGLVSADQLQRSDQQAGMLWTLYRGRLVGAVVRDSGGVCVVAGIVADGVAPDEGAAAACRAYVADDELAGAEPVCLSTVVDASLAGESALLLLRHRVDGVVRFILLELFDANQQLRPANILTFTVSEEGKVDGRENEWSTTAAQGATASRREATDAGAPGQLFPEASPWMLDGPMVCIPRATGCVVAHLALTKRRGEVPARFFPARLPFLTTAARCLHSLCFAPAMPHRDQTASCPSRCPSIGPSTRYPHRMTIALARCPASARSACTSI